jgi:hypothetical protein
MSSWYQDELFKERLQQANKKGSVALQALIFTPLALITGAGVVYAIMNIVSGDTGFIVLLVVSGTLFLVLGYQALHYLRDLGAEPVVSEGEVGKRWTKGNLFFFFMSSHYVAVKGQIFTVSRQQYRGLLEDDMVRIRHYPHSLTVEYVERFDDVEKKYVPAETSEQAY